MKNLHTHSHYQDKKADLIFRYDNAAHKPSPEFTEHKHVGDRISQSNVPELKDVLEEIIKEKEFDERAGLRSTLEYKILLDGIKVYG